MYLVYIRTPAFFAFLSPSSRKTPPGAGLRGGVTRYSSRKNVGTGGLEGSKSRSVVKPVGELLPTTTVLYIRIDQSNLTILHLAEY